MGISLVVAFFILAGLVTTLLRYQDRESEAREDALRAAVREATAWDTRVEELGGQWLEQLKSEPDPAEIAAWELRNRERSAWFDGYYLWERDEIDGVDGAAPRMLYPLPALVEDLPTINRSPCMAEAHAVDPEAGVDAVVEAVLRCRQDESPAVALFASVQAGDLLLFEGRPEDALDAIAEPVVPPRLADAARLGYAPLRVALRAVLSADALAATGRPDLAARRLRALGEDIAMQDGPVLQETFKVLRWTVLPRLKDLDADEDALALAEAVRRAERRLAGWQEVRDRLSVNAAPAEGLQLVHDQYSDQPYLLIFGRLDATGLWGAVQLDQPALLDELVERSDELGDSLRVTTADGEVVAGGDDGVIAASASFPRMLTHLRLAVVAEYLEAARTANKWATLREASGVAAMSILGIWALFALKSAQDKEQALIDRQREFVTRVTHELKTPLAGIRVMAESLEIVGAQDPSTIPTFSERIITETDRLTQRIEEILAIARASKPAGPEPYDLRALLEDMVDEWEPRMHTAGVGLEWDLAEIDEAVGDQALVRDALVCLLDNALKYRRKELIAPRVWVRLRQEGDHAVVEVVDNGIGVPPTKRKVIFERFTRVEGPGRGKEGGHGLGLAFVAEAMASQRGRVECREGIDGGARFVVRLPLS
ncbi:MAG: HAMP domain-containing histidine kinase [Alphaproteobacteria bacterium]|nr:HAMP domain-containing histidine kinase [Alphaproteobacteria bacterium]